MSPVDTVEGETHELLEPCLVEVGQRVLVFLAVVGHQLERAREHEALALFDAAREVGVNFHVPVHLIEAQAVGVVNIDGHLPGSSPVAQILACEAVGGALYLHHHLAELLAVAFACQVEVAVRSVQHVASREPIFDVLKKSHDVTSYSLISVRCGMRSRRACRRSPRRWPTAGRAQSCRLAPPRAT